ncbi:hypothetical protein JCM16358_13350 [Halanaerocella petrolearia]
MRWSNKLAVVLVFMIGGVVWLGSQQNTSSNSDSTYQYQINEPRLISYQQGEKRWDLQAEEIVEPKVDKKEQQKTILQRIKEGKYFSQDRLKYTLTADQVIHFSDSKDMILKGNIVLQERDGEQIKTSKLKWLSEEKELSTTNKVEVKLTNSRLKAQQMTVKVEENIIDFKDQVEMTFQIKERDSDEE